jgi:hypothetical protein
MSKIIFARRILCEKDLMEDEKKSELTNARPKEELCPLELII